ncbi:MAG: hypothetical protein J6S67_19040 [Methanobrevibacter sp.]|nr:hypothetical protein [Methanobrevibacter sp.]
MTDAQKAKQSLTLFLSDSMKLPIPAVEDLIDEAQRICDLVRFTQDYSYGYKTIAEVIYDYLGLSEEHAWIFRESELCQECSCYGNFLHKTCEYCPYEAQYKYR